MSYIIYEVFLQEVMVINMRGDIRRFYLKRCFNLKAALTNMINAGTSTRGPTTPVNASGELSPNVAMATAMANSKLFPAAVNAKVVDLE